VVLPSLPAILNSGTLLLTGNRAITLCLSPVGLSFGLFRLILLQFFLPSFAHHYFWDRCYVLSHVTKMFQFTWFDFFYLPSGKRIL